MPKTIIITGGNSGIGYETAKALALAGHNIIIGCRSKPNGETAAAQINAACQKSGSAGVASNYVLDLSNLASVRDFSATILAKCSSLDTLICNAGIMTPPHSLTRDGFESQFQVNYLGHYLLARLLLDTLLKSDTPKVINVSSLSAEKGLVTDMEGFTRIARQPSDGYVAMTSYRESKLAQVLFSLELDKRYSKQGLFSAAIHPGVVNTNLSYRSLPGWAKPVIAPFAALGILTGVLRTPAKGAETPIFLAQENGLPGGRYWFDKKERMQTDNMKNAPLASALWAWSAEILGLPE